MKTKKTIWSSEWFYNEQLKEDYQKDMQEINEDENFEVTDDMWADEVNLYLEDERLNLNKEVDGVIIAFANLGRWNGRFDGYKIYGNNIKDILYTECDDAEWYGQNHNIRATLYHHDGHNNMLYRVAKDRDTAEKIAEKIYNGELDEAGFMKRTKSLYPYVAKVYGWV